MNIKAEISDDCGLAPALKKVLEHKAVGETSQHVADALYKSISTVDAQITKYCKTTANYIDDYDLKI